MSLPTIEAQIRSISPDTSPFLQRLREALTHCCTKVGVESAHKHLLLPLQVGQYLVDPENMEKAAKKLKIATAVQPPDTPPEDDAPNDEAAGMDEPTCGFSEETKQKVIKLYNKGIRVNYIAELYGVESPKLVHSWGNWSKRTTAEAEANLQKRAQIQTLLDQGETPKAICQELKLKPKNYREYLGLPYGPIFSREAYEKVIQQMQIVKVKNTVSKNTGVSIYIMNKWLDGKDIPEEDAIMDDEEATRDVKRQAIENFYETGSAVQAGTVVGRQPNQVKKWVVDFQRNVDKKSSRYREKAQEGS